MKLLYIYKSIALLAGMERVLTDKMNFLADNLGYEIYLVTYEQGEHPVSYPLSSKVKHIDLDVLFYTKSRYRFPARIWQYIKMRRMFKYRLYRLLRQIQPDIIVSTTYSFPQLDIIANAPVSSRQVLETHIAKSALLKSGDPSHSSVLRFWSKIYDSYMMRQLRKFDVLVTLTKQDQSLWEDKVNTITIPNVLTRYPSNVSTLEGHRIMSVGRLDSQKGYDLLVNVWKLVQGKHPDWELHIWGDGPDKEKLERQINHLQLSRSLFLHPATRDIYAQYLSHSIYVMSSRYEGFGLVLIEAMSCGLPCVSFDCPSGPSEIIDDSRDGYLIESGDIRKMAEAICRLIENEPDRKRMGENARKKASAYSKENIMFQWDNLFTRLCQ